MSKRITKVLSLLLASAATISGSGAIAQDQAESSADEDVGLNVIVVTAQKRSENIQDVPIAISAFTSETLAEKNVNSVQGLTSFAPNVTLDAGSPFSGTSAVLTAFIRGIGQDDFAFNLDPGVGVYVDGVYLARTVGANADLLDVERVEILKGPQGTLFGRNTIGGAISIVTRAPSDEFGVRAEIITGSYDRLDIRANVDLPIVEGTLLSSLSVSSTSRDGYLRRVPFPGSGTVRTENEAAFPNVGFARNEREGGDDQWTVRGKLLWRASDTIDVTLAGDYQRVDQPGLANVLLDTFPFEGVPGELFGTAYNLCINTLAADLPSAPGGNLSALCGSPLGGTGEILAGVNLDADPTNDRLPFDDRFVSDDIDESFATGPSFAKLTSFGFSGTIDADLNVAALKSITAYRELEWRAGLDADGSPTIANHAAFEMNQSQFSQELQLSGQAFNDALDFVVGGYYFEEEGNLHDFVTIGSGLLQIDGNNLLDTSTWAVFTHLNYAISDSLGLTLGARYTEEDKQFEGFQRDLNGFLYKLAAGVPLDSITPGVQAAIGFPDPNDPLRFFPPGVQEQSFSDFSPRIGLEYTFPDDTLLYASYSQGYKSGGWTTRLSVPLSEAPTFEEEEADSYEVGLKSELFNRRLRFNAALFFTEYSGIQLNQVEGISPTVRNAGNAEIYGFEADWNAVLTDAFRVTGSVGYIHDEYTFKAPGVTAGDRLPKTARWKVNVSPYYRFEFANGGRLRFNADYTYTSSLFNDTENSLILKRDPVHMVNGSISYEEPSGRFDLSVGVTNLLDERYLASGFVQAGGALAYGTYSRPTEWFARLSLDF